MDSGIWLIRVLLLCLLFGFTVSIDTITPNNSVKDDGSFIVSGGKVFALGFFSPGSSKYRYVGIWYNQVPERTVVWVANRENPIDDNSGVLSIDSQGSLALYQKNQTLPVWSVNVSVKAGSKNSMAQLLDTGNLVLFRDDTERTLLWQSFDYPSNTLLPLMKLGIDLRTGLNRLLTSWKSQDDPGIGNYSYRIDPTGFPQVSLYNGSDLRWRTGSWTGQKLTGVPEMSRSYIFNVSFVNSDSEIAIMYSVARPSIITRMLVTESGIIQRFTWNAKDGHWIGFWSAPKEQCDSYNHCGPNSNCNPYTPEKFECTCLPGYEPKSPEDWYLRDGSGGCIRKRGAHSCQRGEGFVKVARVKIPDTSVVRANMSLGLKQCEEMCLGNCSCMAYASAYYQSNGGIGCLMWHGDLMDTRSYNDDGQDLYVRVDAIELAQYAKKTDPLHKKGILASLVGSVAAAMLFMAVFIYYFVRRKRKGTRRQSSRPFSYRSSSFLADSVNRRDQLEENPSSDLPFFNLSTVAAATNNFSVENKLGEGGFGSVYKGVLFDGKEIAVKRLSKYSGQGIEEFKNEIMLIAKLQHRNLVRMIGCCVEKEEKMLVYEFMPNKSLDSFIFDETKKSLLDWRKRFEIICGVARGILYLHQDSRLRIIHRDLKASNVLLDVAMNPKISDFGMARMFGGEQVEGKTRHIVGTYGYMSPEYAMKGLFSIKSDVYSFGVLLLEIISGIKNNSYCSDDSTTNLIEHVWDLWKEGKAMEIVDSSLWENSAYLADEEVLRCIQIGLLCVQACATDRPAMSSVVFMLGNAEAILPRPNQPAFAAKKKENGEEMSNSEGTGGSVNEVTITKIQGR